MARVRDIIFESLEQLEPRLLLSGDPAGATDGVIYRINAGGGTIEVGDTVWQKDSARKYNQTNQKTAKSVKKRTRKKVKETTTSVQSDTPEKLFRQYRQDRARGENMQWDLELSPGRYEVRLYFAETRGKYQAEGARVFDVYLEGQNVINDYDVFSEAGANTGTVRSFLINVDGNLDIDFEGVIGEPMINGIEVLTEDAQSPGPEIVTSVPIYDGLLHANKPKLTDEGFARIKILYESNLWPLGVSWDEPHLPTIRQIAEKLNDDVPVVINIEHWEVYGNDAESAENIGKLITIVDTMKEVNPNLQIGFYRLLPKRDYWASISDRNSSAYKAWQRVNDRLHELADKVDIIAPSLYTFYEQPADWQIYARESLREAEQYGKPVIPYIWPRYHQGGTFTDNRPIPAEVFRDQLEFLKDRVDGIIIWGGWDKNGRIDWDDNLGWVAETREFISTL